MVIVQYKDITSSEWKRESFVDPRHYRKWRTIMGKHIVDVKPVRAGSVRRLAHA